MLVVQWPFSLATAVVLQSLQPVTWRRAQVSEQDGSVDGKKLCPRPRLDLFGQARTPWPTKTAAVLSAKLLITR